MHTSMTLSELFQEHFDGVLATIDSGRWGRWVLDREQLAGGRVVLRHERTGFSLVIDVAGKRPPWPDLIEGASWATGEDIGSLVFAVRDLEYAQWLGVLPIARTRGAGQPEETVASP